MTNLIQKCLDKIKKSDSIKDLFKEYDVSLDEIDLIPICFKKDLEVSARTEHAIIYLNDKLAKTIEELCPYLIHEITHYCQQTTGDKPTKGSNDDNYLDNPAEKEGFQNQTKYISETDGEDKAEKYIEKVLNHHNIPEREMKTRKKQLLNIAATLNKNAGWLDETPEEKAETALLLAKKEQEKKEQQGRNISVAKKVADWFSQFAIPRTIDDDFILEFNPEHFSSIKNASAIFDLPEKTIMDISIKVDCLAGKIEIYNIRVVYSGAHMSEQLQKAINLATGKTIKYHKPTNAWVYDAQIDGKLKPGDPKMILIGQNIGQLSKIKTASKIRPSIKLPSFDQKERMKKLKEINLLLKDK